MIISKNIAYFKILMRNLQRPEKFGESSTLKIFQRIKAKNSASATLPMFLIGCNSGNLSEDICEKMMAVQTLFV